MATGGLTAIRDNFLYVGWGAQSAWGTDVAPTNYWKWRQGTMFDAKAKITDERLGDTDIWENLTYKESQYAVAKVAEAFQPITAGCGLKNFLGANSETYTAPTKTGTLSASVAAGATSFSSSVDLGNTGTLGLSVEGGIASTNYEVVTVDCTTRSGAGPYVYSLAASAAFKLAHNSGAAIATAATHALVADNTTYNPFSLEFGLGTSGYGTPSRVIRLRDAVAYTWGLDSGPGGKVAMLSHDWYAAAQKVIGVWATPAYEQGNLPGSVAGSPFTHNQASGAWQLNNLATGNAATIRAFKLNGKRDTSAEDFITEGVTPAYFLPGNMSFDGSFEVVFTSWKEYDLGVFGKTAASTGDTDSYVVGTQPFQVTYTADAVNTFKVVCPTLRFAAAPPKLAGNGRALVQQVQFKVIKTPGTQPLTATLTNSYQQAY